MADSPTDTPAHRYTPALAARIEARWQDRWDERNAYRTANPGETGFDPAQPKLYVLDMFPYPSGAGLHVGHPLGYIATDIFARYKRMRGYNVLHAMGFDAFGLPAEQYAIDTGTHPRITTEKNVATFRAQLRRLGLGHELRRGVSTTDVAFYKWTQWIFLQIYNAWFDSSRNQARHIDDLIAEYQTGVRQTPATSKPWHSMNAQEKTALIDSHRLVYLADVDVNWCPALGTVLANEEVTKEGRSDRGNHPVYKRPLRQWMMRITAYAERLLTDLDQVDWPEPIKLMQRNWVGRSEGAFVDFASGKRRIRVFTTRPDTLAGATYMVLAPEHPLVDELAAEKWGATIPEEWKGRFPGAAEKIASGAGPREMIAAYRAFAASKSDVERQTDTKEKTGVFIGTYAVNPVTEDRIPVFIADYVLTGYGTGAIMAVPAHDDRDYEFARQLRIPMRDVVYPRTVLAIRYFAEKSTDEDRQDTSWKTLLADFLGSISANSIEFPGFAAALQHMRSHQRESDGKRYGQSEASNIENEIPGILGDRSKKSKPTWREVVGALGVNNFDQLREWFRDHRFYAETGAPFTDDGIAVNSTPINSMHTVEAKQAMARWLEAKSLGKPAVQYKLRDWLFSRQRYWGEPFPIVYEEGDARGERPIPLPEHMLPVELPDISDYKPVAGDDPSAPPKPPLGRATEWVNVELDLGNGTKRYRRELNTMPQWAGSCWYYLRYLDPENSNAFVSPDVERYWMLSRKSSAPASSKPSSTYDRAQHHCGGVDLYVGGAEHAVLHLLYARFWHKVLFDLGHVSTPEPFGKLFNQGYIQAPAYTDARGIYVDATRVIEDPPGSNRFTYQGEPVTREFGKMGKSLKNVITPDDVCDEYGADSMRLYEMYMGPLEQSKPWNPRDIVGVHRFLQRVWRAIIDEESGSLRITDDAPDEATRRLLHKTIDGVSRDLENLSMNTAIAKLIEFNNHLAKTGAEKPTSREAAEALVLMLAPLVPHFAEELWSKLRPNDQQGIIRHAFPVADPAMLIEDSLELPVQIQGKVRGRIVVAANADEATIRAAALADDKVAAFLSGKTIAKFIVVPGRMVNIVAN